MRLSRNANSMFRLSFVFVVVSGSPEESNSAQPRLSASAWTTSPRLPCCFRLSRTPQSRTAHRGATHKRKQSPAPKAGVLPSAPVSDAVLSCSPRPCFRRRISSLSVGREALESSSAVLQTAARPSQLPAQVGLLGLSRFGHEKRLDVCVTPSLHVESNSLEASVT